MDILELLRNAELNWQAVLCGGLGAIGVYYLLKVRKYPPLPSGDTGMVRVSGDGSVKPVRETEEGKLFNSFAKGICPDCGSTEGFYEGPSGGMSTNYFCANRECRQGFNVTPFPGMDGIAERIQKANLDKYPKETPHETI